MQIISYILLLIVIVSLTACRDASKAQPQTTQQAELTTQQSDIKSNIQGSVDYHSYANSEQVKVTHLDLDLTVNFEEKVLSGYVDISYSKLDPKAEEIVLDTRDIAIQSVASANQELAYILAEADANLGSALHIELPETLTPIRIHYTTSPYASGLQWLNAQQTAGKQAPFLFSQAQAIHARSFIPVQDSPAVRVTYTATIRTPDNLLAVMSASNDPNTQRDGVYEFTMPQPIPAYLIAIAVGDLHFKPMGERTGVYAEMAYLETAAKEFEDTEAMLIETEKKYGPYQWDRYDLLILPPSFPFGGMENPRLSFITPTVMAGDKSLVSLIAHELAHSWSGNSVTNATWRDLWLNEGFTTYLTYRIMEMIFGKDRFDMEAVLGYQDLQAAIDSLDAQDERLAIDLRGRDPDDVFSNIPYEKGALFLREIEHKIGRDNFDQFLVDYFAHFAFQSITTDQFVSYLKTTLLSQYPDQLDENRINEWIFSTSIPLEAPIPQSNAFSRIDTTRSAWLESKVSANDIQTNHWTVHEWLYFLNNLPDELELEQLNELDQAFNLTASKNNEIAHSWLMIAVRNWYSPALPRLHDYLVEIGRNKLVRPLYRELAKTDQGKAFAKKAFEQAKPGYHPLTVKANEGYVE
jgi:leukotriene A-4 hydrolase/aminopeptidase